jgi:hypothetical protein
MTDDELLRRLDRIQTTLELAFKPQLDAAREQVRVDPVNAAILDATSEKTWTSSTVVQKAAAKASKVGERTIRTRLPELVDEHFLDVQGSERAREYRRTGLV